MEKTKPEFEAFKTEHLAGYTVNNKQAFKGRLENTESGVFKAPARQCQKVLFELGANAKYTEGLRNVELHTTFDGKNVLTLQPGIYGPGGIVDLGCFRQLTSIEVQARTSDSGTQIGTGDYRMVAYNKPASEQEIATFERRYQATLSQFQHAAEADAQAQAKTSQECGICRTQWDNCMAAEDNRAKCGNEYNMCGFKRLRGRDKCPKL